MLLLLMALFFCAGMAQKSQIKMNFYKTWVGLKDSTEVEGVLYQVTDTSIVLTQSLLVKDYLMDSIQLKNLHCKWIETIQTKRKNAVGRGALIGAACGFFVGAMVGFTDGDDENSIVFFSAEEKALLGGFTGAIAGAGIGVLLGSFKLSIPINRDQKKFRDTQFKLKKRALIHQ